MILNDAKVVKALAYAESVKESSMRKRLKEESIEALRGQLELTGAAIDVKITTSASMDALPSGVARLIELIQDYCDDLAGYVEDVREFNEAISHLDPTQMQVLSDRYVRLLEWKQIADEIGYSEQHTYRIREAALLGLYDHMPEEWRSRRIPDAET